jgi:hypothetical protein
VYAIVCHCACDKCGSTYRRLFSAYLYCAEHTVDYIYYAISMAPRKDPTNAQLSSRLRYAEGDAPAFLARLRAQVAGRSYDADEDEPAYEFEDGEGGRPAIPRRPPVPTRPDETEGTLDEEDAEDEAPQVIVLKEGKHLSEREAENERRKGLPFHVCTVSLLTCPIAKGLSPLPDPSAEGPPDASTATPDSKIVKAANMSNVSFGGPRKLAKRKAVGDADSADADASPASKGKEKDTKKSKKQKKTLLSFGDDA